MRVYSVENSPITSRIVTITTGFKTNTLLLASKLRKKLSGGSGMVSMAIVNVAVAVATLDLITNSLVVGLIVVLIVFEGFVV